MTRILIALAALGLILHPLSGQSPSGEVLGKMATYHTGFPQEKVYMHHDKPYYVLGEVIWYKVYLVDAILHQTITPSQQVIVELYDPANNLMSSATIWIEDGCGAGDFELGPEWQTGRYLLRAYTAYQRNFEEPLFFEKEIRVFNAYAPLSNPDLSERELLASGEKVEGDIWDFPALTMNFFPEGGQLVDSISTSVGLNIYDENYNGVAVQGEIIDRTGSAVSKFVTHESGLGFFRITPKFGEIYKAVFEVNGEIQTHALPEVDAHGYVLNVQQQKDELVVHARASSKFDLSGCFIIGHLRGNLFCVLEGFQGREYYARLVKEDIPEGILHFTLFEQNGRPVSERLSFVFSEDNRPRTAIRLSDEVTQRREEISVSIDNSGDTSQVYGSLTITDLAHATPDPSSTNIRSYLLCQSDIRGKVPMPGFLMSDAPAAATLRDILMLTHGWKRFVWDDLLRDPVVTIDHLPENSLSIKGFVTRPNQPDKRLKAEVFMSTLSDELSMLQTTTGDDGEFVFANIPVKDTTTLLIQASRYEEPKPGKKEAKNKETKEGPTGNRRVDIYIEREAPPQPDRKNAILDPMPNPGAIAEYFAESRKTQIVDSAYSDLITVELGEVVIREEKKDPVVQPEHEKMMMYKEPDSRIIPDSMPFGTQARNVFELIRGRVPGVTVVGTFPNYAAQIRGLNSIMGNTNAVMVLDGVVVTNTLINNFPVQRIAFIDVLRGLNKSLLYGSEGNGVIAIYTKTASQAPPKSDSPGSLRYLFPGYYQAQTFQSPDYGNDPNNDKPDYRTTLFWSPDIRVDGGKTQALTFYTSDRPSVYSARFEGITMDGRTVVLEKKIEVR